MKIVRIVNGQVREVIPPAAVPVSDWYGAAFAAQCVEAPDEVEQHWIYDAETETFSLPPEEEPAQEPTVWDELDAAYQEGVKTAYDS